MLRRVLISIAALGCLLLCYAVYVRVVGNIAHFAPLEQDRLPPDNAPSSEPAADTPPKVDLAHSIAEKVFGPDSWQAKADIQLYWLQSGVIIYVADYDRAGPQSLVLKPFSLVYQEKSKASGAETQTITIQADEAVLDFDHAIDIIEASGAKPTGGRISGNVQIQTDRGTAVPDDDYVGYCDVLEFNESEQRIWTDGPVRIVVGIDGVITGVGAEAKLQTAKDVRGKADFGGVQQLALLHDVQINLVLAGNRSMLGGNTAPAAKTASTRPARNTPMNVSCEGPFVYDVAASTARFQRNVQLVRQTGERQADKMFCDDEFWVVFEPRPATDKAKQPKDTGTQLTVREARATGTSVRIVSDAQGMEAVGNEMHHDAVSGVTVLRGSPNVTATQRGNVIQTQELKLNGSRDRAGNAEARGPGNLEVRDESTGQITLRARWSQSARVEPQGAQQLLTLAGAVQVEQPDRGSLRADRVKVWLARRSPQPGTAAATEDKGPATGLDQSDWQPARIESIGNVVAESDQLDVRAGQRLDMTFQDQPQRLATLPAKAGAANGSPNGKKAASGGLAGTGATAPTGGKPHGGAAAKDAPANRERARLSAKTVQVTVLRNGATHEVSEVWTEGDVDLFNPPTEPDTKGAIVRGQIMHMKQIEQGNLLEVTGSPAHVELQQLTVEGPTVAVDQGAGVAWVEGKGMMQLPVDTDLDGHKLPEPGELIIHWGANMFFDGGVAEFGGGVEVKHTQGLLRCRRLEAFLAERINLAVPKDLTGTKNKAPGTAQIAKLICSEEVQFDNVQERDGQMEKLEHFEAQEMTFTNSNGQMLAKGPGLVRTYTRGQNALVAPQAKPAPGKQPPPREPDIPKKPNQIYFTEIHFADQMEGNRTQETARFRGQIEGIHSPVEDETRRVDPNKLPSGGMRLACQELEIGSKHGTAGKSFYEMVGTGNVDVEAREFVGRGDRLSYNQEQDRMIFEARPGSFASLYRQTRPGEKPDEARGRKIWYFRSTDRVRVEDANGLDIIEQASDKNLMPKGRK